MSLSGAPEGEVTSYLAVGFEPGTGIVSSPRELLRELPALSCSSTYCEFFSF